MLKGLINSAVSAVTQLGNHGAPQSFKFQILEKIDEFSHFSIFDAKVKSGIMTIPGMPAFLSPEDAPIVSVFIFKKSSNLSQNCYKKMLTLRHPNILRVLDSVETDSSYFIATEHITPLTSSSRSNGQVSPFGLYEIFEAISFIQNECKLVHGLIDPASVYVTDTGCFRLAGFEFTRPAPADRNLLSDRTNSGIGGLFSKFVSSDINDLDWFGYLTLIWYLINGTRPLTVAEAVPLTVLAGAVANSVPFTDTSGLREFILDVPKKMKTNRIRFFNENELIEILKNLNSIHLNDDKTNLKFLENLQISKISNKSNLLIILDSILHNIISIPTLVPHAIPIIISISSEIPLDQFKKKIQPKLIELFTVPDRGVRYKLLVGVPVIAKLIDSKTLESSILNDALSGFTDSHPKIREETLNFFKKISNLVSDNFLNSKLNPNFSNLLRDSDPSIRLSTIQSVLDLSPRLSMDLIFSALISGLRDSHRDCRLVCLNYLKIMEVKSDGMGREVVLKILPLINNLLLSNEFEISQISFDLLKSILPKIQEKLKHSSPSQDLTTPSPVARSTASSGTASFSNQQAPVKPTPPSVAFIDPFASAQQCSQPTLTHSTAAPERGMSFPSQPPVFQDLTRTVPPSQPRNLLDGDFDSFWNDLKK
jgi:SCY1-like protein 1